MAKKSSSGKFHGLMLVVMLLLQIFFGVATGGVMRILKGHIISGILYIITGGFFLIGWIVDVVSLIIHKDYVYLWSK